MIEIVGLVAVICVQVLFALFGYYSAVGHVNRMLDIEEPDSPQITQNLRSEFVSRKALTVDDIDSIDDWDAFESAEQCEEDERQR